MIYVPWFTKPEAQKKALQIVNLSPNESMVEKLSDIHPMRQIVWATVIQGLVFAGMLFSFCIINGVVN
jgi:hypothetical protein